MKKQIIVACVLLDLLVAVLVVYYLVMNREKEDLNETTRANLPGQFVQLSQGVTHYETAGDPGGAPVILVHGFSAPAFVWDPLWEELAASGHFVIRYDLYGRGYSDRPEVDYTAEVFTRQLDDLIAALEIKQSVDLAALSLGGAIAAAYTNQHPEKVNRLVLIDPQSEDISPQKIFPVNLPGVGEYLMTVYILPEMLAKAGSDFAQPGAFPEWEEKYATQMKYRGFRRALLSTLRNFDLGVQAEYQQLGTQGKDVLILWGEADADISRQAIDQTHTSITGSQLVVIEDAGHNSHYERPDLANPAIIEFLK